MGEANKAVKVQNPAAGFLTLTADVGRKTIMKKTGYSLVMILTLCVSSARSEGLDMTGDALRTLTTQIENLTLNIGINPATTNYGLRSITLYVNYDILFEPDAEWPDGTPVTAHAQISRDEAIRTIHIVSKANLFGSASKSYSERTPITTNTPPPSANAKDMRLPNKDEIPITGPSLSLQYVTFDEHWYSYYNIAAPWRTTGEALLPRISEALSGDGKQLIDTLTSEMRSVQPGGSPYSSPAAGSESGDR
jgi:hypothetical protein